LRLPRITGDEGRFATYCLKRLTRTLQKGERRLPPSEVELEAVKNRRSIIIRVHMMAGQAKALDLDASTSTKEIFQSITEKINLTQVNFPFNIFLRRYKVGGGGGGGRKIGENKI
jgi:hypothetical protein